MFNAKNAIDLNSILKAFNTVIILLLWYSYFKIGDSLYVNFETVLLGTLLSLQIALFLILERKKRDPFVLILCLQMIIYFIFRIIGLMHYEFSHVFQRFPFNAENLNHALIFILMANMMLYLGITVNGLRRNIYKNTFNVFPKKTHYIIFLLAIGYFFALYQYIGLGFLGGIMGILQTLIINLGTMIFMSMVFLLLFRGRISKGIEILIFIGIIGMVLIQTLTGSRSAILGIINYLIFALLAINDNIKVQKKYLLIGVSLLPIMIFIFAFSTFLRPRLENRAQIGTETITLLNEFNVEEGIIEQSDLVLAQVSDRIGFLDYCAEIISNSDKYQDIFNTWFYFKSIVDNILTPGFTVFDTPKVANATTFIYNGLGAPSLASVDEAYHSDQLTLYGEFYALFGMWTSLVLFFFVGFFFKKVYLNISQKNIYQFFLKRAIVLYLFYTALNSFGLDWLLLNSVAIYFTFQIFKSFFKFVSVK